MRQCTSVTDRQTDSEIVAQVRDVYITSRTKNDSNYKNKYGTSLFLLSNPLLYNTHISKLCPQIKRTEGSYDIYISQWPIINVTASCISV